MIIEPGFRVPKKWEYVAEPFPHIYSEVDGRNLRSARVMSIAVKLHGTIFTVATKSGSVYSLHIEGANSLVDVVGLLDLVNSSVLKQAKRIYHGDE